MTLKILIPLFLAVFLMLSFTGEIFSGNSPAVFYISLGQLEGNSWGIVYSDSTAYAIAQAENCQAWESAGLFLHLSLRAIQDDPGEYLIKVFKNTVRAVGSGVYIGEWRKYEWATVIKRVLIVVFAVVMLWLYVSARHVIDSDAGRLVVGIAVLTIIGQGIGQQLVRHTNIFYLPLLGLVLEWRKRQWEKDLSAYSSG